jgi:hypothetical protein
MFSFRACRDPHARRGIWRKCFPVFWILDAAKLSLELAETDALFSEKLEFGRLP